MKGKRKMNLRMFGIGTAEALAGEKTKGTVTQVKTCYWLKVNTKPVRAHMADGARFPHIIHIAYSVDGKTYTAKRWVPWHQRCPVKDESITVNYEPDAPEKYGVFL